MYRLAAVVCLALFALLSAAAAKSSVLPQATELTGLITRFVGSDDTPVAGAMVVLHRVGADTGGALDSIRTSADGRFRLLVPRIEQDNAVYFLSTMHHGVAYFTPAWEPSALDTADADIIVFDTTSAPVPLSILGRVLMVSAPMPGGSRRVAEVFEIANDSNVTRVALGDSVPVWRSMVPAHASEFSWGPNEANAAALEVRNGEVLSFAPFAPGVRAFFFSYVLPPDAFPLSVPVTPGVEVLEVLLEEQRAVAEGLDLIETAPLADGGRLYRRFQATDFPDNSVLTVQVPAESPLAVSSLILIVVGIVLAGMAVALWIVLRRGASPFQAVSLPQSESRSSAQSLPATARERGADYPAPRHEGDASSAPDGTAAETIARQIAELDERYAALVSPSRNDTETYRLERETLKKALSMMLAQESGKP